MTDSIKLWLPDAEITRFCGNSLAFTLYAVPVDILLSGELGAGKTTFLQGFAQSLGIGDRLVSPTYALEQRYTTSKGTPLYHLDLYRLTEKQASDVLMATDGHDGIRCIEWADRMKTAASDSGITLSFAEKDNGRELSVSFRDMRLPSDETIRHWRSAMKLPAHIAAHCDTVAHVSGMLAETLTQRGIIVRISAVQKAGLVHDLLRFVDFRTEASPPGMTVDPADEAHWEEVRQQYAGLKHEAACAEFVTGEGYPELGRIVLSHGLTAGPPADATTEQKILYYADKRVLIDKVVTLEERFADFARRYAGGQPNAQQKQWYDEAIRIERELFPEGVTF